jgi:uncharacterized protein YbjT (DUF2867 family)
MDILVTGASSKAGGEIVRGLTESGARVRATVPLRGGPSPETSGDTVAVDFTEPRTLYPALSGVDKAVVIVPETSAMGAVTQNLVAAAERAGVAHLLLVSFLHADLVTGGSVLRWHREAEEAVRASSVPSTIVRPNYYMQNFLSAYSPAASLGSGRVSYIDAADVAAVIGSILLGGGHEDLTYSLTGPRALSREEVSALLGGGEAPGDRPEAQGQDEACEQRRRSGMTADLRALCEFWATVGEERFADVTPDFEQLMGRAPRTFERFVREHRGELQGRPPEGGPRLEDGPPSEGGPPPPAGAGPA